MVKDQKIVMRDSDEAAKQVTVTGWVSRNSRFYGEFEDLARYDGCTHVKCSRCDKPCEKGWTACSDCRDIKDREKYDAMPKARWDGVQMISAGDDYYYDLESFLEHCEDEGVEPADLLPLLCEPNYAREVEPDFWCDELAEDGELPAELEAALEALNTVIRQHRFVLSWSPGKTALDCSQEAT